MKGASSTPASFMLLSHERDTAAYLLSSKDVAYAYPKTLKSYIFFFKENWHQI